MVENKILKNKILFVVLSLLLFSLVISGCAKTPQQSADLQMPNEGVFFNLITLQALVDYNIVKQQIDPLEGFIRLLLAILLFALLFKGAELLKLGMNISIVISAVITIITIIFVPSSILVATAATYGTIFSVIIAGAPIVGCFAAYWFLRAHLFLRTIVLGVVWWVVVEMVNVMNGYAAGFTNAAKDVVATQTALGYAIPSTQAFGGVVGKVTVWLGYVEYAVVVIFFWNLWLSFLEWKKQYKAGRITPGDAGKWVAEKWHNTNHRFDTRVVNQSIEGERELKLLEVCKSFGTQGSERATTVLQAGELDARDQTVITSRFDNAVSEAEKAKSQIRKLKNRTWRQEKGYDVLRKSLKQAGKDTSSLDALEANILKIHEDMYTLVDGALNMLKKRSSASARGFVGRITTGFPVALGGGGPSGSVPSGGVRIAIENLRDGFSQYNAEVDKAIAKEREAARALADIIARAKDIRLGR